MLRNSSLALAVFCLCGNSCWADQAVRVPQADLITVYNDAMTSDVDLAVARASFAAVREVVPQARAGLMPNLAAGATANDIHTGIDQPSITASRSANTYQATLNLPIFHADHWFQLNAAKAISEQAALQFSSVEQSVILRSAEDYFAVLRAQDSLATTKAEEVAFKRQLDQAMERFATGLADKTDTLQAQASLDTSRANRIVAERQVEDAFQTLSTLTNREYAAVQGIGHSLPMLPPSPGEAAAWVQTATQQNLKLQASNFAVGSAEETVRQRKAGHAPTLDAVARYQKGDNDGLGFTNPSKTGNRYDGDVEQRSIGLQLSIPLYSGGLTNSQVVEAVARLDQSAQQREVLRRQVVESTRNLYRAVSTDVVQARARRQSIISIQSAVQATEIGYRIGTRDIVDVLDTQRQLYAAVRDYNNTRYDYILDCLRLKQAVGTLSPVDLRALQGYLKTDYNPDRDFLPPDVGAEGNS